jgi:hypothetical protein
VVEDCASPNELLVLRPFDHVDSVPRQRHVCAIEPADIRFAEVISAIVLCVPPWASGNLL